MATANAAVMHPKRTLCQAHSMKRSHGSTDQSAASGRNMKVTGATNPMSTGRVQTAQAAQRRAPRSRSGCASAEPARPPPVAKRMRFCARCSRCSSAITTTSSMVASCAAASRLSIDSQAL